MLQGHVSGTLLVLLTGEVVWADISVTERFHAAALAFRVLKVQVALGWSFAGFSQVLDQVVDTGLGLLASLEDSGNVVSGS